MKSLLGKKLVHKVLGDAALDLPADKLSSAALRESHDLLVGHSGVPHSADSLAYEPVQRLLAVSASCRVRGLQPGLIRLILSRLAAMMAG